MFTDLAVTALIGAVVLLALAGALVWIARQVAAGVLPFGGRLALRPSSARTSPEALLAANQTAAPFAQRYGMIVAGMALLAILLAFVNDIAAVLVHLLAVVVLAVGLGVCWRKAGATDVDPATAG